MKILDFLNKLTPCSYKKILRKLQKSDTFLLNNVNIESFSLYTSYICK